MFRFIIVLMPTYYAFSQDISPIVDVKTLSELPLDRLLQVKSTFQDADDTSAESKPDLLPQPQALVSKRKPNDRGGYHYEEEYSKKSGKKSVQSIFQISVTTLAFLAFGGYLLCLLVQAVKNKDNMNMNMMNMNMMTMQNMAAFYRPIRRRRPTRRPTRLQNPRKTTTRRPNTRRPTSTRYKREIWPETNPESMYYALVNLSEAYANYHTIDYRRLNYTASYYQ